LILSIIIGLLIWLIVKRNSSRIQIIKVPTYKLIFIPIGIISYLSTFVITGYYKVSIFSCNSYLPLSYPLEITHCSDNMPTIPTFMDFYFRICRYKIFLFKIAIYSTLQMIVILLLLGTILFILNYSCACIVLFIINKIF